MARLHEYQGKALLKARGIAVPDGGVATTGAEARAIAEALKCPVVVKVQAWTTSRKAQGGVKFADSPDEVEAIANVMLGMTFGNFPVAEVLVEQQIDIRDELFLSMTIDDAAQAPVLLLDLAGGSGIEERADSVARIPITLPSTSQGEGRGGGLLDETLITALLAKSAIDPSLHADLVQTISSLIDTAQQVDARSLEVNPLVTTTDGRVMAADCRITIDDYAVFRHPELGIEIARELDHPPTALEKIAYAVEEADHRGTFYFAQLAVGSRPSAIGQTTPADSRQPTADGPLIGFHGAGGGGSMMSMDAVTNEGFALANFCDTSGNPSAAKVYRAARIILSQPGLVGYFGSGSGVASQEQFWSAYGLAKAFIEMNLSIPAVIRLGGNSEDRAVEILEDACKGLPATVEGYRKDDTPAFCARRFAELVEGRAGVSPAAEASRHQVEDPPRRGTEASSGGADVPQHAALSTQHSAARHVPAFVGSPGAYSFPIGGGGGGTVWIDHESSDDAVTVTVIANSFDLLTRDASTGKPILAVSEEDIAGKDSEMIALEIECRRAGVPVIFVDLTIPGLDN